MKIQLDDWQQEFLDTKGDKVLCCGRQVGKSVICGMDAGEYSVKNKKKVILMIAPTERQAYGLFSKTLAYIADNYPRSIKMGKDRPTHSRINLKNGTLIWCLPTGLSGLGVRFLTVDRLYADEASRIWEPVWDAVTPMLLTTGGDSIFLSTPAGPEGYFADVIENKEQAFNSFTRFTVSSEKVVRDRPICDTWTKKTREKALARINIERVRMSALTFAQEYEGMIVADLKQFFRDDLIKRCMTITKATSSHPPYTSQAFLGVDVARMGGDECVLASFKKLENDFLEMFDLEVYTMIYITDTVRKIQAANSRYNYQKIGIDDGGMGVGVYDPLREDSQTKRKVIAINNASRSQDYDFNKETYKKLLKEDLYNNLLRLMEQDKIKFFTDDRIAHSLKSIQKEFTKDKNLKISGTYSHITEAIIRAAWVAKKKTLKIYIA